MWSMDENRAKTNTDTPLRDAREYVDKRGISTFEPLVLTRYHRELAGPRWLVYFNCDLTFTNSM